MWYWASLNHQRVNPTDAKKTAKIETFTKTKKSDGSLKAMPASNITINENCDVAFCIALIIPRSCGFTHCCITCVSARSHIHKKARDKTILPIIIPSESRLSPNTKKARRIGSKLHQKSQQETTATFSTEPTIFKTGAKKNVPINPEMAPAPL